MEGQYDSTWVERYFDEFADQEWDRLALNPMREIQFLVHRQLLLNHVGGGSEVLEVGAGPGKFTQELVRHGCQVTVADISSVQLELNQAKAKELGFEHGVAAWEKLDLCDLSQYADESFDAVVAYGGPLSYVLDRRDVAIAECVRVLRPGGVLLVDVMNLFGTIRQYLEGVLGFPWVDNENVLATGDLTKANSEFATHYCHLFRSDELWSFLEANGLAVVDMAASNNLTAVYGDRLDAIRADEQKWTELVELEMRAVRQPGCLDSGTHLIGVARKLFETASFG
ncbi:MAG: methyltransferase domain-containing protein [Armatimonadetes bacterium]|nr:methyltransferase domain-containing protein [Armatimonadota bacterium]